MTGRQVAEDVWREQSLWSQSANKLKARIQSARVAALCVTSAVAVLGTSATAVGIDTALGRVLAGVAAFGAAIVTLLQRAWSGPAMSAWTRARSVSEALKSEVYLWLARAGTYGADGAGVHLRARADEVSSSAQDLSRYQLGLQPEQRTLPDVNDGATYFTVRVAAQIDTYYTPGAEERATRLTWFRRAQLALAVLAAVLGAVSAASSAPLTPWIAVVTTIGLAVAAHVASTRYEFQLIEFLRTATELTRLQHEAGQAADDAHRRQLAVKAESVISVENQAWMAKLTQDEPPAP